MLGSSRVESLAIICASDDVWRAACAVTLNNVSSMAASNNTSELTMLNNAVAQLGLVD